MRTESTLDLAPGTSLVDVTPDDLDTVQYFGTVTQITGTDREDPTQRVTFAGDHRSMDGLLALLDAGNEVPAVIEDWQVLSTRAREAS
jgi:hypothetical protein